MDCDSYRLALASRVEFLLAQSKADPEFQQEDMREALQVLREADLLIWGLRTPYRLGGVRPESVSGQ